MMSTFDRIIDGVTVQWREPTGLVVWMSDWTRVDELAQRGYLRRIHRSGHGDPYAQTTEFYVDDELG